MSKYEARLTDATKREIANGRREIKEGKGMTRCELLKRLNVKHRKHAYKYLSFL